MLQFVLSLLLSVDAVQSSQNLLFAALRFVGVGCYEDHNDMKFELKTFQIMQLRFI